MKDGSSYVGEARGKKPHGQGKIAYANGDFYEGAFVKGKRSGKGVYTFKDGERYEGEFFEDRHHGGIQTAAQLCLVTLAHILVGLGTRKELLFYGKSR